jgi:hypothetical protein
VLDDVSHKMTEPCHAPAGGLLRLRERRREVDPRPRLRRHHVGTPTQFCLPRLMTFGFTRIFKYSPTPKALHSTSPILHNCLTISTVITKCIFQQMLMRISARLRDVSLSPEASYWAGCHTAETKRRKSLLPELPGFGDLPHQCAAESGAVSAAHWLQVSRISKLD